MTYLGHEKEAALWVEILFEWGSNAISEHLNY